MRTCVCVCLASKVKAAAVIENELANGNHVKFVYVLKPIGTSNIMLKTSTIRITYDIQDFALS